MNGGLIKIPVSAGELVDKITILEIKKKFISRPMMLESVKKELNLLNRELDRVLGRNSKEIVEKVIAVKNELYNVNLKLWKTENELQVFETNRRFGADFIKSARKVYTLNHKRSRVKKRINKLLGSAIREAKQYGSF